SACRPERRVCLLSRALLVRRLGGRGSRRRGSWGRCSRGRGWRRGHRSTVDEILQLLAGIKVWNFLCGHIHTHAGLWIAPDPGLALPRAKAAEAPYFDLITRAKRLHNTREDRFDDDLGVLAAHLHGPRNILNKLCFGHV